MITAVTMIVCFYLVNFFSWDLMVDNQIVSPQWASIIVYTILFIISLMIYGKHLIKEWQRFKKETYNRKQFLTDVVIASVLGAVLTAITFYGSDYFWGGGGIPENQDNIHGVIDSVPMIFSAIMITLFGPVIEELTFRESIIGAFFQSKGLWYATTIFISIIAFDLIHVVNLYEFWSYLPMAVILTLFYIRYKRNVWSSILLHVFYNFIGYLIAVLAMFFRI